MLSQVLIHQPVDCQPILTSDRQLSTFICPIDYSSILDFCSREGICPVRIQVMNEALFAWMKFNWKTFDETFVGCFVVASRLCCRSWLLFAVIFSCFHYGLCFLPFRSFPVGINACSPPVEKCCSDILKWVFFLLKACFYGGKAIWQISLAFLIGIEKCIN